MSNKVEMPTSPPLAQSNISVAVTDRIREMIVEGRVQPGDWLRQDELARELGVSPIPVREAMRHLQAEGLVVLYPRRGTMVAKPSLDEFEELNLLTEDLEALACTLLPEHFDAIPLDRLRQILSELEEVEAQHDVERRLRLVREFRFLIWRAPARPHLFRVLSNLWDLSTSYRRLWSEVTEAAPARLEGFRRMYLACENRDVAALLEAVHTMYALGRRAMVSLLETSPDLNP